MLQPLLPVLPLANMGSLRNDSVSQFISHNLHEALKGMGIEQEFTHIASPQENGFIESLHSQIQREVIEFVQFIGV